MSEKTEALWLADRLEGRWALHPEMQEAAAKLRRLSAVEAQRDALLEALRRIGQRCPRSIMKHPLHLIHQEMAHDAGAWARAAIKAVEGEKT